ncbi:hypothetical protein [Brevundimonas sp.]|jgi:hypothetical protein|uniref:hypothetical protein n=1 Tax=Brevundimonas sp. TaxID=1871086 RepID=UPI0037BEE119
MKTILLASAAAATLFAAPAFAQDAVGSVGVAYNHAKTEAGAADNDMNGAKIDGVVATPAFGDWTVTFNAAGTYTDSDFGGDETGLSGAVHLTKAVEDMRFGGFVSGEELPLGYTLTTFGAEGQKYFDRATLTGVASYGTAADADLWTVGGEAAFYATPALRLAARASYSDLDVDGASTDGWSAGVNAEYAFAATPYSVYAGYDRSELEDFDVTVDAFEVGVRYNFGGGLQARDRAGANLGRNVNSVLTSLFRGNVQ